MLYVSLEWDYVKIHVNMHDLFGKNKQNEKSIINRNSIA